MSTRAKKNLYKEKSMNGPKNLKKTSRSRSARQKIDAGSYRIIGGQWRSRRVNFPVIEGLRPTTDRVRETLFNWLSFFVDGASVLDVFSGSGALGFEALSRGASSLVAVEKNAQAAEALKQNLALLQGAPESSSHTYVQHTDALLYLAEIKHESDKSLSRTAEQERATFDLIFIDPPFRKGLLEETFSLLDGHPAIQDGALIYVEFEKEMTALDIPKNWKLLKDKTAGQVSYRLYKVDIRVKA